MDWCVFFNAWTVIPRSVRPQPSRFLSCRTCHSDLCRWKISLRSAIIHLCRIARPVLRQGLRMSNAARRQMVHFSKRAQEQLRPLSICAQNLLARAADVRPHSGHACGRQTALSPPALAYIQSYLEITSCPVDLHQSRSKLSADLRGYSGTFESRPGRCDLRCKRRVGTQPPRDRPACNAPRGLERRQCVDLNFNRVEPCPLASSAAIYGQLAQRGCSFRRRSPGGHELRSSTL